MSPHAVAVLDDDPRGCFIRCCCTWQTIRFDQRDALIAYRVHLASRGIR